MRGLGAAKTPQTQTLPADVEQQACRKALEELEIEKGEAPECWMQKAGLIFRFVVVRERLQRITSQLDRGNGRPGKTCYIYRSDSKPIPSSAQTRLDAGTRM
jgi:hypothetical protein